MNIAILDSIPIRIYRKNRAGEFTYANAACIRDLGQVRLEDVLGRTDFDFFDQSLAARWREQEQRLFETGKPVNSQVEQELWTNRPSTWVKTSKILEPEVDSSLADIWGVSLDITDDYHHLQMYKGAVEGHRDGVWHYHAQTSEIWVSPQCHEMLGLPTDSGKLASVKNWILFVHRRDRARVISTYRSLTVDLPHGEVDCRFVNAFNVDVFARIRLTSEFDEHGVLVGVSGSVSDRSEYERKYRSLLDLVPSFIFVKNKELRFEFVNRALADAYGDDPDNMVGKTDAHYNKNLKQLARFREADLAILEGREKRIHIPEETFDHQNSDRLMLTTIKVPRPGVPGEPEVTGVVGVATDITDFARTRRIFETLIAHIPDGVFFKDRSGQYRHVNPAMEKYLSEHNPIPWEGKTDFDFFAPEIANEWKLQDEAVFGSGKPELGDVSETDIRGETQWRRASKVPVMSLDDEVIGLVGITHDLTEERSIQFELRNKTNLLQAVLDTMPLQISLQAPDGTYQLCNREFAKFFGVDNPANILGKRPDEVIQDPDARVTLTALLTQAQHGIEIKQHALTELDGNLNRQRLLVSLYPVKFDGVDNATPSILTIRDNLTNAAKEVRQRHQTQVELMDWIRREENEVRRVYLVLLGLTHVEALGLNRALLFRRRLRNRVKLKFVLAIGQPSQAAAKAFEKSTPELERLTVTECLRKFDESGQSLDRPLNEAFHSQFSRLLSNGILVRDIECAEKEGKALVSTVPFEEQDEPLWRSLRRIDSKQAVYGIIPIDDTETWLIVADNVRSGKNINSEGVTGSQESTHQDILAYCRAAQIAIAAAKQNADHRARISSQIAWRTISGDISHRLENIFPFTQSRIKQMLSGVESADQRERLLLIQSDLNRALRLIKGFRRHAPPITPAIGKSPAVRVEDFLKRVKAHIDLHVNVTIHAPAHNIAGLWLRADDQLIQDCFAQLAANSQMHSKLENPACTIRAMSFESVERFQLGPRHDHWLEIQFSDNGVGVPKQFKERIFEPMFTRHKDGSGMGLAIARKVVEAHGGRIREIGALNDGALFSIILPLSLQKPV